MRNQLLLTTLNNIDDLRSLRALYKANGISQVLGYQTLDNYISWFEKEPQQKHIKIYTLPEVWRKSGLYMIVDRYQLMVNALDIAEAAEELRIALPQLDWSRGYKMTGVPDAHHETIYKLLTKMNLLIGIVRLHVVLKSREEALKLDVSCSSPEFDYHPLSQEEAAIVDGIWYSRGNGTLKFIERLIAYNNNMGIYLKSTGELIAWCIRCNLGLLGMLHVKDDYRGRGLAKLLVQMLSRQLAGAGEDVLTMISDQNATSQALFKKLKFEEIGLTYIYRTKRHEDSEIWSDELEAAE
ncbi:uncharacterized protein LOC101450675 [Ceratitis capitata]|uniref:uncharacterized protein LOC101450675 n=1 Tax=Ceratitis capitata TaxID=7213 RepID=UPI0003298010|nr:uncharacterized protein LOC101450675 [Ceratitis capitata]